MATVLDFAAGFPPARDIKAAGHVGVVAYVSPSRPGSNFGGKPITRKVADEYRAAGVQIAAVWQYGKPNGSAPSDWTTGRDGGRRMAREARDRAFAAGMPGYCPIFFAVDEDIDLDQWNRTAVEFFRGVNEVLGREWTGIYGSAGVCAWAIEDNVIGGRGGKRWAWQTRSWSNGEREDAAVLFQRVIDTPSSPGPRVGGITVDVNDVLAADWGQWSIDRAPRATPPAPAPTPAPPKESPVADYGITKTMHGYNATSAGIGNSNGPRASTPYFVVHTQEARSNAVALANFCNSTATTGNPVAYNLSIDGRDTVEIVPLNEGPWAAADANNLGVHVCIAGSFAAWSRRQWLDTVDDSGDGLNEDLAITRAAKALAAASQQYGIPLVYAGDTGRSGWPVKGKGVVGHMDFGSRGGGHHDPGTGFPFDELIKRALNGAAAVVNQIDAAAAVAKNWIGARITKGENICPDKIGRWAEFANAHIYWTPETGAHPIPHGGLFEAWAEYKWETGPLRYPVRDHAVVKDGGVQAFQGGVLYRKNGSAHGFYVHGEIGKQFAADGYETGRAGWPTTLEYVNGDGVAQDFDNGTYRWSAKAGVTYTSRKA